MIKPMKRKSVAPVKLSLLLSGYSRTPLRLFGKSMGQQPFADCRCRIDITSDDGDLRGILRMQIVSWGATTIRRESPESRIPRCGRAAAMGPSTW
jgi:hypothetical protein